VAGGASTAKVVSGQPSLGYSSTQPSLRQCQMSSALRFSLRLLTLGATPLLRRALPSSMACWLASGAGRVRRCCLRRGPSTGVCVRSESARGPSSVRQRIAAPTMPVHSSAVVAASETSSAEVNSSCCFPDVGTSQSSATRAGCIATQPAALLHFSQVHPKSHWFNRTVCWGWEPTACSQKCVALACR
jgi:hypothetical protein